MAAPEKSVEQAHHTGKTHPGEGTYFSIFVLLAVLTVAELTVVYMQGIRLPLLIGLASAKAWLVMQFYMHLRYEKKLLTWVFLIPIFAGALMTVLIQPLIK